MSDKPKIFIDRLPTRLVYASNVIASHDKVMKNRGGKASRLQSSIGRVMPHLKNGEVLIVIDVEHLKDAIRQTQNDFKRGLPEFKQEYMANWGEPSNIKEGLSNLFGPSVLKKPLVAKPFHYGSDYKGLAAPESMIDKANQAGEEE